MWNAGGTLWRPEGGFYARRWHPRRDDKPLFGVTAARLCLAIDAWTPAPRW